MGCHLKYLKYSWEKIFDENIVLVKDDSEALNGEKTNLLQNSLSFLFLLQIDFLFNLPTLHPTQCFISILFFGNQIRIFVDQKFCQKKTES